WAVGDRGTLWHTEDGGATWRLVPCPTGAPLYDVCFLTDRVGWVVGGATTPYTQTGSGVVLFTQDGGRTWRLLAAGKLPRLRFVRFFGMTEGVAAGEGTSQSPSGVFTTTDGGETWTPVAGERRAGWTAADFTSPEVGVVAGLR